MSAYDQIARLYDPWSKSVVEDVGFYVEEAVRAGGTIVELGVGTGRIAVPIAAAGVGVIGVDTSAGMLAVAAEQAQLAGVAGAIDLRHGDMRDPPVDGTYPLVLCPFRSLLHMETDDDRRAALGAIRRLLAPGGRFVFDVFTPGAEDIADTHGRWLEREPGIWERADWNQATRTLILRVRGDWGKPRCRSPGCRSANGARCWRTAGFAVDALYGWFDRSPWRGGEDSVWVCRASS